MQNQQCLSYPQRTLLDLNYSLSSRVRDKVEETESPCSQSQLSLIICLLAVVWATALGVNTANAQGALTNGGRQDGGIASQGEEDSWTLAANPGDHITVQIAELSGGAAFTPMIELRAPDGAFLGSSSGGLAARLDVQADAGGTYTVLVRDARQSGTGTYRLQLAQVPGVPIVPDGDEGGTLTNGLNQLGAIDAGDLDQWTFAANQGDRMSLQVSRVSAGVTFAPMIALFGPNGARLGISSGGVAARLDAQAAVGGTYTVVISAVNPEASGNYQLQLAEIPGGFTVPIGDEGGPLSDGVDQDGTIALGDLDLWTFAANPGDRVTLKITELTGGALFTPKIELFTPGGELKGSAQNSTTATIDTAIESGGTYSVLVSDATRSGAGTYRLNLTRSTIAPPGPNVLTNGATVVRSIASAGETNFWTFTASVGDSIVLRVGEVLTSAFNPWIRLLNPNGTTIGSAATTIAAEIALKATNSGTFTVVVSDGSAAHNQTGGYRVTLAKTGSPIVVSADDEGGPMTNGVMHTGTISVGDLDVWNFTANAGDSLVVRMGELVAGSSLTPYLQLFGPDGALLDAFWNSTVASEVSTRATNSGTFTVIVADLSGGYAGSGTYRLNLVKTGSPIVVSAGDDGGPMTNGVMHTGTIDLGDLDVWNFTANAGESIVLRMGELVAGSSLTPYLQLFGPDGALLDAFWNSTVASEVSIRATNSGTFTVVAADLSGAYAGSGTYRLKLVKTGSPIVVSTGDDGGPMTNGVMHTGTIDVGDLDVWNFTANAGESIVLRMGELVAGSSLTPYLQLFGPNGALLDAFWNSTVASEVSTRATNSGTFTVVAADLSGGYAGSGAYRLKLTKTGSPIVVSAGDDGGPMTNGLMHTGTIEVGDLDVWNFTANAGESMVIRMGELVTSSSLTPYLRLFGPDGALLDAFWSSTVASEVSARATNSGTFTVIASDLTGGYAGSGTYRLKLAKTGSRIVVSTGDEGGPMTAVATYDGMLDRGDVDVWSFTACAGDLIEVNATELVTGSSLTPWIRLYARDGVLLKTVFGAAAVQFNMTAPASGSYTVVLADLSNAYAGIGTYRLTVNGLSDGLKLCIPSISSGNLYLDGIGGTPGASFTLLTTTNVAQPMNLWTPLPTMQFDQFGVFTYTNTYSPAVPQQFFRLLLQ